MNVAQPALSVHAVGIDLGTTYSCLSYLTPQGEPVTLPNQEGELSTPSVVLFEGDQVVVGTEALRNAVSHPDRVVQNAKRHMGDPRKFWVIDGETYRPDDIAAFVLRKLLDAARQRLGPVRHAVITVPAQFSDVQRQQTAEAGRKAGLERVDIINEPVAAALCHVLSEGMWFAELAHDQTVMVYDLGGGTFDLSLVRYNKDHVSVIAGDGDLQLGGIDWNSALETWACKQFIKETPDDPRLDRESMQALANEVEQTKRSLSVRPKASLTVQHAGRRKVLGVTQEMFEQLTSNLVQRSEEITKRLLKLNRMGWAHIDAVLVTGGSSRMPMIRRMLQRISGTTLNTTLSPDQSISYGAAYYAGMLLSGEKFAKSFLSKETTSRLARFRQQSVNARALGILVRDTATGNRTPHYLIPAGTPLPCAFQQTFGTVVPNQKRVHLHIVESGTSPEQPVIKLGACVVEGLPPDLPEKTPIEVTIRYDEQARVHVSAKETVTGAEAKATIVREENLIQLPADQTPQTDASLEPSAASTLPPKAPPAAPPMPQGSTFQPAARSSAPLQKPVPPQPRKPKPTPVLEQSERPVPLCNQCGEPLDARGRCPSGGHVASQSTSAARSSAPTTGQKPPASGQPGAKPGVKPGAARRPGVRPMPRPASQPRTRPPLTDEEILELDLNTAGTEHMPLPPSSPKPKPKPGSKPAPAAPRPTARPPQSKQAEPGEQDFWELPD